MSRGFLQPRSAELLKAEIEAEGCRFMLGPPRASAGLPVVQAAVLLARSSGLVLKQSLGFSVTELHHLGETLPLTFCVFDKRHGTFLNM